MPRGVYDRSKSKAERAAAKAATPAAPKQAKKYLKKSAQKYLPKIEEPGIEKNMAVGFDGGSYGRQRDLRGYMNDLRDLRATVTNNTATGFQGNGFNVVTQIDAELTKVITALSSIHFPVIEQKTEAPAQTNGAAAAPAPVAAPVPFNPPTFAQAPSAS